MFSVPLAERGCFRSFLGHVGLGLPGPLLRIRGSGNLGGRPGGVRHGFRRTGVHAARAPCPAAGQILVARACAPRVGGRTNHHLDDCSGMGIEF